MNFVHLKNDYNAKLNYAELDNTHCIDAKLIIKHVFCL